MSRLARRILPSGAGEKVAHAAKRVADRPFALGVVAIVLIAITCYIGFSSLNGAPFQDRFKVSALLPANSPALKPGDSLRVGGTRAGVISDSLVGDGGAKIKMEIEPTYAPVGRDATAQVRQRGASGFYYVDITRGDYKNNPMPEEGLIPRSQTTGPADLIPIIARFDPEFRSAMARSTEVNGRSLMGRGGDFNTAIADLRAALPRLNTITRSATRRPGAFSDAFRAVRRTGRNLAPPGSNDLEALVPAARGTFDAFALAAPDLQLILERLRPFEDAALDVLPVADPLLRDGATMAVELRPAIASLNAALPDLNRLLTTGGVLRREAGRLTRVADPALRAGVPALIALRPVTAQVRPLVEPLASTLRHLAPYDREIFILGDGIIRGSAATVPREADSGKIGELVQRANFIFTCQRAGNPYPKPGEAFKDSEFCRP